MWPTCPIFCAKRKIITNFPIKEFDKWKECKKFAPLKVWKKICRNNAIDFFRLAIEKA